MIKYLNKWRYSLGNHFKNGYSGFKSLWKRTTTGKIKIFIVDDRIPTPNQDAASLRMFNILKILSVKFHITFYPLNTYPEKPYVEHLKKMGVECVFRNSTDGINRFLKSTGKSYDYFICSRSELAEFFLYLKEFFPNAYTIFDTVDLSYIRIQRQAQLSESVEEKKNLENLSKKLYENLKKAVIESNEVWTVTETEKNVIKEISTNTNINVIPTIHPIPNIDNKRFSNTENILFIGAFEHAPNADAVNYFLSDIWPFIISKINNIKFIIIGSNPPDEIKKLATNRVIVKGFVPHIETDLLNARVFSAPLRFGAGMKGKIGQSLSYGIPTVTTSIGAEGFGFKGNEIIIRDDPKEHADAIIKLYNDETMWGKYHENGYNFMKRFSPEEVQKGLFEIFK